MAEDRETRLKRLRIRSWRRGTREMDLILGRYADEALAALADAELDAYERLLEENDQDLYAWMAGSAAPDPAHHATVDRVRTHHKIG